MLYATQASSWVYPGAKYDLDFANNRYWGGNVFLGSGTGNNANASLLTEANSGASSNSFFAPDSSGILRTFPQYALRITSGMGLWVEGNYTNYCLYCRDMTQANWTKTNVTTTKNQTGSDATANGATSLTSSATSATCLQSITQASTTFVGSAYVKRLTGTGVINMTIDGGTTWTAITSSINTASYSKVSVPNQTIANPTIGFQIATSGDSIAVDFVQCENNTSPTTPIFTTSATLFRGAEEAFFNGDQATYNDGQRLVLDITSGHPAGMLIQYSGNFPSGTTHLLFGDSPAAIQVSGPSGGGVVTAQNKVPNTVTTVNSENSGLGNLNKVAVRFNGLASGLSICLNGGTIVTSAGTFSVQQPFLNHGGLGNIGAGTSPINGYFSRCTFWRDRDLTDGEMIKYTT